MIKIYTPPRNEKSVLEQNIYMIKRSQKDGKAMQPWLVLPSTVKALYTHIMITCKIDCKHSSLHPKDPHLHLRRFCARMGFLTYILTFFSPKTRPVTVLPLSKTVIFIQEPACLVNDQKHTANHQLILRKVCCCYICLAGVFSSCNRR